MSCAKQLDAVLLDAADSLGTPCYLYSFEKIQSRIESLRHSLGRLFSLSYAVKCNPNPGLLEWLNGRVEYLDVSSIGEFRAALASGWDAKAISFTGPGKREFELEDSVEKGVAEIVLESTAEAKCLDRICRVRGTSQKVLIRIAPASVPRGFGDHMAGRPGPFGIDVEDLDQEMPEILSLSGLRVAGFHIYSGTQCLVDDAICENMIGFCEVFLEACRKFDIEPEKLVFGSGFGVPYHVGDRSIDVAYIANRLAGSFQLLRSQKRTRSTTLLLELGRYLVGEAGYFLTRVVRIKRSRGKQIAICDGGMNNHLPASGHFGMVIRRNYKMHRVGGGKATSEYDLVGPLCTSIDKIGQGVLLPELEEGDVIAIHNSGAYGLTASPVHFISHPVPAEGIFDGRNTFDVSQGLVPGSAASEIEQ